ncbi:MAG: hypothetical protein NC209_05900 [Alistipes sp.]|nr:hypothetical protein [Alistipes senegalensis]MCM1250657.1 hypothetical protein [Alistipes sp.]
MKNPIPSFLHLFLRRAGIRIDELRIRALYGKHPLPHSIRSLRDTLDDLHVATRIDRPTFGQLPEFERPFIVTAGTDQYPFFLVERLDVPESTVSVRSVSGRRSELSFERFRALWSGTVLTAAKSETTQETNPIGYLLKQTAARVAGTSAANPKTAQLETRVERLLNAPETFRQLLALQPVLLSENPADISVSNFSESDRTVIVAIDPATPRCARAIEAIARLDDCRIELLFSADKENRRSYNAALRMISSGIRNSWDTTLRIIADWYRKGTLPADLDVHPLAPGDLEAQTTYCRNNGLTPAPTVLIDSRPLPDIYDIEDLKYLL